MEFNLTDEQQSIRAAVRELCGKFSAEYWRNSDRERAYPEEFVQALTQAGWLAALIPEEYEGAGLGITEASLILEEINYSGGNSAACHAQMYIMGSLLRHGNAAQKSYYLPKIGRGELRLQAFGVTEPDAGSDTTKIKTRAIRQGEFYLINGQKVWTSRFQHSDLMLLLARTTPLEEVKERTGGLSLFLVDLHEAGDSIEARPIEAMVNHETNQLFINDLKVPASALIGEEGQGFRYILDSWNAERILIAAECIGDGRWFVDKASRYASERVVFGKPIGTNQGVQFPIAQAHAHIEAADLLRHKAAWLFDQKKKCGAEANLAKLLASQASWEAANVCLTTHGGYGLAVEYDIERKFRETRLYTVAPVNNNLVLAYIGQHVLNMPKSY